MSAFQWVRIAPTRIAVGDLVSADAGGLPIYRVAALDTHRAWLRDETTGRDHVAPLSALHWKFTA
jgi:hypothetical protein